jgi:glutamine amidotransferase PdxT
MNYTGNDEFDAAFFDNASAAWRSNKIVLGELSFKYRRNAFGGQEDLLKKKRGRAVFEKPVVSAPVPAPVVSEAIQSVSTLRRSPRFVPLRRSLRLKKK